MATCISAVRYDHQVSCMECRVHWVSTFDYFYASLSWYFWSFDKYSSIIRLRMLLLAASTVLIAWSFSSNQSHNSEIANNLLRSFIEFILRSNPRWYVSYYQSFLNTNMFFNVEMLWKTECWVNDKQKVNNNSQFGCHKGMISNIMKKSPSRSGVHLRCYVIPFVWNEVLIYKA